MRKLCFLFLTMGVLLGCSAGSEDIVIAFDVASPTAKEVVLVAHQDVISVPLDSLGRGEAVLSGMDALYARVFYGREFKWIYAEVGDKAEIGFDGHDFKGTFVFKGDKAPAVNYLNNVRLTALPDEDYALPFNEYVSKVQAKEKDAVKLMKANGLSSAGKFERMEEARVRYSYGATLLMHPIGHIMMTGNPDYKPSDSYYEVIDSYMVEDKDFINIDEYRAFVIEGAHVLDEENREVSEIYPKTLAQMKFIADRFKSAEVKEPLLNFLAVSYVDNFGVEGIQELENIYRTYIRDSVYVSAYDAACEKWNLSKPGKISPDFHAENIDGKVLSLKDFRGKYVYIDMWATWCSPCRKEMPYLRELEKKFQDAEIVFVGLSVDKDKAKWAEMVSGGSLSGVQLYLGSGSAFQRAYKVAGIPHFILLDKEGRIISNDMSRPSDPQTEKTLESLDGIR